MRREERLKRKGAVSNLYFPYETPLFSFLFFSFLSPKENHARL
jgi:hypothetical protein